MSLSMRRRRQSDPFVPGGGLCASPENDQPGTYMVAPTGLMTPPRSHPGSPPPSQLLLPTPGGPPVVPPMIQRPLPASFPNRRTVFFFDWDDTLCPTTWIRSLLKEHLADSLEWAEPLGARLEVDWREAVPNWFYQPLPDEPFVHECIAELQEQIIALVSVAQTLGVVCIVTNSVPGWVQRTTKKWLPALTQYIFGHGARPPIHIIYGQEVCPKTQPRGAASLPWVDASGPYLWWKRDAMAKALDEIEDLYRLDDGFVLPPSAAEERAAAEGEEVLPGISWCADGDAKRLANVVSIGDDEAEMSGAEIAALGSEARRSYLRSETMLEAVVPFATLVPLDGEDAMVREMPRHGGSRSRRAASHDLHEARRRPWVKLLKLSVGPHIRQLIAQLQELSELLPQVVELRRHLRVDLARPRGDEGRGIDSPIEPRPRSTLNADLLKCSEADLAVERFLRMQVV